MDNLQHLDQTKKQRYFKVRNLIKKPHKELSRKSYIMEASATNVNEHTSIAKEFFHTNLSVRHIFQAEFSKLLKYYYGAVSYTHLRAHET